MIAGFEALKTDMALHGYVGLRDDWGMQPWRRQVLYALGIAMGIRVSTTKDIGADIIWGYDPSRARPRTTFERREG